jgi:hypothetical protein
MCKALSRAVGEGFKSCILDMTVLCCINDVVQQDHSFEIETNRSHDIAESLLYQVLQLFIQAQYTMRVKAHHNFLKDSLDLQQSYYFLYEKLFCCFKVLYWRYRPVS